MEIVSVRQGEGVLQIGGQRYTLVFDLLAMATAENYVEATVGRYVPFDAIFDGAQRGRLTFVVALYWAGMRRKHPEITIEAAADLVATAMADKTTMREALRTAKAGATPDPKDVEALKVKRARPRKAQAAAAGTGVSST